MSISRFLAIAGTIASMLSASGTSVMAAVDDVRAKDAFDLFDAFCVQTSGSREKALSVIGNGNALANKLRDSLVTTLQNNQSGGVAWAMNSPGGAKLLLGYTASGVCEVRIAQADQASVEKQFSLFTSALGVNGRSIGPEIRSQNEAKISFRAFNYEKAGRLASIAMTTADKVVGAQQHLITFAFVQY